MTNLQHRHAVIVCRFWWERYRRLPRWRVLARRKALAEAHYWASAAIKSHTTQ